jgi:outer membrane receptor protein involved in Fe transport
VLSSIPAAVVGASTFPAANRALTSNETSGKLAIEYRPEKANLYYSSVSRGVKSGAFTAYNSPFSQQIDPVKPETLIAYELGFKKDFSPSLRVNGAAFFYDYRDQQFQSQVFIDPVIRNVGRLVNIPKSEISGIEFELQWEPVKNLKIGQLLGYKKGKYKEYQGLDVAATRATGYTRAVYSDFAGQTLPLPRTTYGGSASYNWNNGGYRLTAQGDYAFQDTVRSSSGAAYDTKRYWLANARFAVSRVGEPWELALWVKNLFDKDYDVYHGSFLSNAQIANAGHPRSVGVQASYTF